LEELERGGSGREAEVGELEMKKIFHHSSFIILPSSFFLLPSSFNIGF